MTHSSPSAARLHEIAEDVHAYIQPDGGWCLNNAGLITAGGRPLLIDTAATEARAGALKEAVARVTAHAPGSWSTRTRTATTPSATASSRTKR